MQILLSARGLAALAWLNTFAALWAGALGIIPNPLNGVAMVIFSFLISVLAMAVANPRK